MDWVLIRATILLFISGDHIALLDPQEKYLKNNGEPQRGIKGPIPRTGIRRYPKRTNWFHLKELKESILDQLLREHSFEYHFDKNLVIYPTVFLLQPVSFN